MLYIVCGGKGNLGCVQSNVSPRNVEGGYNGGGLGYWDGFKSGDGHSGVGSGGGATHIGKTNSLLSSTAKEDLYIVAGGGGGACVSGGWNNQGTWHLESSTGGSGGGLFGNGEPGDARKSLGGTQSAGGSGNQGSGSYGQGSVRGGGGGFYGGGASYSIGGGGGSGYIEGVPNFIYVEGTEYKPETQNGVNEGNGRACITFVGTSEYEEKTVSTEYCYDRENKNLLASFSDEGEIVKYVYGNGLISSYTSGDDSAEEPAVSYYLYDLRGSAEHITDDEGDIVSTYAYSAYGQRTVESGTETPVGYCGRDGVLTEDNGLLYMRARYYAPSLQRFVNQDIVVGDISNSNSLNRYSYVEGNPVTMVDPFGLCAEKSGWQKTVDWFENKGKEAWEWIEGKAKQVDNWVGENSVAIMIGTDVVLIVGTVLTDGALMPVLISTIECQVAGEAIGAGKSAIDYYCNNGTLEGAMGYIAYGANKGGAYGCMGGLLFGAGYEAVNIYNGAKTFALAGESLSKFAQKAAAVTGTINEVGKKGEAFVSEALGLPHNNEIINMYGRDRIPDFLDVTRGIIAESKNVANLSYTQQLKDYALYAEEILDTTLQLFVRRTTVISKPLQEVIEAGKIILEYFDW